MSEVRPGDVIAGKFQVERVLGEGGMGYVVAARHLQLGQMVALKFMHAEVLTPEYRSRFLREARNTVRLKSKHVSRILDVGALDGGAPYIVMEYLEGTDLSELLHSRGPVPVQLACEYVIQACEAISEAHGYGIVHRDLKPANLFLTKGPNGEPVVKVLDFGVSKVLDLDEETDTSPGGRPRSAPPDSVVTKVSDLLGSPSYMAPEQVVSARDADARSDIWSLGVILFRLISGKAPFVGVSLGEMIQAIMHAPIPNLRDVRPDLPPGLEIVVARCLERDRTQRLGDASELARLLAVYAGPVAAPSLERIAILGPALVTTSQPPPAPLTQLSHPSFPPSFQPAPGAWSVPPPPPDPGPRRADMAVGSAILWGGLFVVILSTAAIAAGLFIVGKYRATQGPTASAPTASATMLPEPFPPAITLSAAGPGTSAKPVASGPGSARVNGGGGHGRPRGAARPSDPKPAETGGEIPSTCQ